MEENFLEIEAFKVEQPLSTFYIAKIPADKLLDISFSETLQYVDEQGKMKGNQRVVDEKRLESIARYIDSSEMTFPNTVILAANYSKEESRILDKPEDIPKRWKVEHIEKDRYRIIIPKKEELAAVIDGQHRLQAFNYVEVEERKTMDLICSIFFDLPNAYQAFLFATINGNQKKVDQSLALEQFGFSIGEEPASSWTPEKLAVSITRKLNSDIDSPFHMRIKLAPIDDNKFFKNGQSAEWTVSTATIVGGLLSLFSSKPKRDRVEMGQKRILFGRNRNMIKSFTDSTPLRLYFLENKDAEILNIVKSYFKVVESLLWSEVSRDSYIFKTVGIQALFDVLKEILKNELNKENVNFSSYLSKVKEVDFSDNFFQASGVGKSRIKNIILYSNNMVDSEKWETSFLNDIKRILKNA